VRRELKNAQAIVALLYDRIVTTVCGAAAAIYYPFSIGLLLQPNLEIIGRHATMLAVDALSSPMRTWRDTSQLVAQGNDLASISA
jgi:hypothetical protein